MKALMLIASVGLAAITGDGRITPVPVPAQVPAPQEPQATPTRPWSVGEKLTYNVKFGWFTVGRAHLEVLGIDTVRADTFLPAGFPMFRQHPVARDGTSRDPFFLDSPHIGRLA